jgi:hypothetical protein
LSCAKERIAMKHTSTLRSPYRVRGLVTDAASTSTGDASLRQAALATKSLVVALCLARVIVDWLNGAVTFEGLLAVAVVAVIVLVSLTFSAKPGRCEGSEQASGVYLMVFPRGD